MSTSGIGRIFVSVEVAEKIKLLPSDPGVYQFRDSEGKIIYVGKAKNLKNRVSSYFSKSADHSGKTRVMVRKIRDLSYIVVDTELDALLLENNLIKKYRPRYNILLKDDKTYPWICVKNERFPRVIATRKKIDDGSRYFGPYASVKVMNTLLTLIHRLYKIRTCNYVLSEENIKAGKFRVCLEYHIGNCRGPCEGKISVEEYMAQIEEIVGIVKGDISSVIGHLETRMHKAAEELEFELAQELKEKIDSLKDYRGRSAVVNPSIGNVDVLTVISDLHTGFVNYMKVVDGAVIQSHTMTFKKGLEVTDADILTQGVAEIKSTQHLAKEVLVSIEPLVDLPDHRFAVPQRGDKKLLLDLSLRNAKYYMLDRDRRSRLTDPSKYADRLMDRMKKDLSLKEEPRHIECFDNSNLHGTNAVAACVVFRNGKPQKKEYRHFNIRTVDGPDDYASMREVVYRRYKRLLDEGESLPQLIVIDGGKGQLSAALESLDKLGIRGKMAVIGIAKRLEEIYFPGDSTPLYIDKRSETLKVLQQIRDEAHRFGITHHRKKRSNAAVKTELTSIPGIGKATAQKLLHTFRSAAGVKRADLETLTEVIGESKARMVRTWFDA